jgi:hypothetical protein
MLENANADQPSEPLQPAGGEVQPALAQAYQVLAHSSALAIQDAVAHMRNMSTISATASGTALSQMLATGDVAAYAQVIEQANAMQMHSINQFKSIAAVASELLRNFPQAQE